MQQDKLDPSEPEAKLLQLQKSVEELSKDPSKLLGVSLMIKQLLISHHLSILLFMDHNETLVKFLECWSAQEKKYKREQMEVVFIIFGLGKEILLKLNNKFFGKISKALKITKEEMLSPQTCLSAQSLDSFLKYESLLKRFLQLKSNTALQTYPLGLALNDIIKYELKKIVPKSQFQEVIITWLKKEAAALQTRVFEEKKYQNVGLCCKIHFEKDFPYPFEPNLDHYHIKVGEQGLEKDFFQKQGENIRKIISYFLNNLGGYLYLGILVAKQGKKEGTSGIPLTDASMLELLNQIEKQIIVQIFPTDDEDEDENEEQEKERLSNFLSRKECEFKQMIKEKFRKFELSKFIEVEFLNVYDKTTLLFSRSQKEEQLFSLQFKVKIGDPAELYFVLNKKELPEAYTERDKALIMIDYYNEVYKRLKDRANNKLVYKDPKTHALCLHSLKFQPENSSQFEHNDYDSDG